MRNAYVILLTLFLGACASPQGGMSQFELDVAKQPLTCKDKAQCDVYWQRAQTYIVKNSRWKIQLSNDTLIQTYGPGDDPYLAYTVNKVLKSDGSAEIEVSTRCGNMFGCEIAPWQGVKNLKEYVKSGG
jgi:hypothetical protein